MKLAATLLAVLWFIALVGFALRYRRHGRDLDSWLCLSVTLAFFADLHLVLTPVVSSEFVLQGDFLRLIAYGLLLVGVWRAIADAEFGRAVADERARVAREIHDGLAQYLFAISTQVNMLETGAPLEQVLPRLKRASIAAQQEARFAVLALSSAGGSARFDSALRRYVEVLTADGEIDVEVDVDRAVRLAPDEQIEVFRIVQEGLGNARRHAGASHVEVEIAQRNGRRVVRVRDDGVGFDEETTTAGQGLENMRLRADAIQGELSLDSTTGPRHRDRGRPPPDLEAQREELCPLTRVEVASAGVRVEALDSGRLAHLPRRQPPAQAARDRLAGAEAVLEKAPVRAVLAERDQRRLAASHAQDRGVHARRRRERGARQSARNGELEPRTPERAPRRRGPDGALLVRELPLHDRVRSAEPARGVEHPREDRERAGERKVRDDRERLERPCELAGVELGGPRRRRRSGRAAQRPERGRARARRRARRRSRARA